MSHTRLARPVEMGGEIRAASTWLAETAQDQTAEEYAGMLRQCMGCEAWGGTLKVTVTGKDGAKAIVRLWSGHVEVEIGSPNLEAAVTRRIYPAIAPYESRSKEI